MSFKPLQSRRHREIPAPTPPPEPQTSPFQKVGGWGESAAEPTPESTRRLEGGRALARLAQADRAAREQQHEAAATAEREAETAERAQRLDGLWEHYNTPGSVRVPS